MQVEITVKVNGQVVREHVEQVSGTLEDMEEKIDAMSRQVAGAALEARVDAVTPPRPPFSKEGGELRPKGSQARTLSGLNGPVTVRRAKFRCVKTGTFEYPLDRALDLPPHEVTVSLGRRALRLGTHMSFATLQEEPCCQPEGRLA